MGQSADAVASPILKAHRFLELDAMRGLAAVTVVLAHFSAALGGTPALARWEASPAHVLTAGHEAVIFFFVLSGFVLSVPYSGPRAPTYWNYLLKRLCRIYLPFAAAALLAFAGAAWLYGPQAGASTWLNATWSQRPSVQLLLSALLMSSAATQQLNTAFWSIIYEVRISLIFPCLYFIFRTMRLGWAILLILAACALASLSNLPGLANCFVAGLFSIGILLFRNLQRAHGFVRRMSPTRRFLFLICSGLLFEFTIPLFGRVGVERTITTNGFADLTAAMGAAGLIVCATQPGRLQRFLTSGPLLRLGLLSYSTYLLHATVLFCLVRTRSAHVPFLWYLLPYLLLVYAASEAFYLLVDKRSVLLGRRVAALLA